MKFYKLELINREDNFNKMFGTNPNVGVINPLGTKPQTGKQTMIVGGNKGMPGMGMGIGMGITGGQAGIPSKDGRKNSRMVQ